MYGIIRSRLATVISKNHSRLLPFNPNSKKLITTTTSTPPPPSPSPSGSGWIDKLMSRPRNLWIFGSIGGSLVGSTAFLSHKFIAKSDEKLNLEKLLANIKYDFDYDEHDLVNDESIRKLYDRWLTHHDKYHQDPKQKEAHYQAFKESAYSVYFNNKTCKSCRYELNKFSDMTEEDVNRNFYVIHE